MSDERYPEHAKLSPVQDEYNAVREFMEWATSNGLELCRMGDSGYRRGIAGDEVVEAWNPQAWRELVNAHFGVDETELERERRAMVDGLSRSPS